MNEYIQKYLDAGLSVFPVRSDKTPAVTWGQYRDRKPTIQEYENWGLPIALIAGQVICVDFDDAGSQYGPWVDLVESQVPGLVNRLVIQRTPSGGKHCVYKTPEKMNNVKLAQNADRKVLIETRGEGGYFIISPSTGYDLIQGDFLNIPALTPDEHNCLITSAKSLNQLSTAPSPEMEAKTNTTIGITPFDEYDLTNNPIQELLSAGWSVVFSRNGTTYLRRPGKEKGISATWNHIPNRFFCFSSSTAFENEHIYKASAVYTILKHNGNFKAAAKDLFNQGFGKVSVDNHRESKIVKSSEFKDRIEKYYSYSGERGKRISLKEFSDCLRIEKGQLNVITGVPTSGKSMFMDFLTVELAAAHQWKWAIFSPENYPMEIHFNKLATSYLGKRPVKDDLDLVINFIDAHYRFIDATEEDLGIEAIMAAALHCKNTFGLDGLVIDPWNEIESSRPKEISETDYIGVCLRKLRKFARKYNISLWIVAHPAKPQRIKGTNEYAPVNLYDISSSANWYNKVDNGIIIHRDKDDLVSIIIAKIKYRDYGIPGIITATYDFKRGIYETGRKTAYEY